MIYSLLGSVSAIENYWWGGGEGAPHHLHPLFCKCVNLLKLSGLSGIRAHSKGIKVIIEKFQMQFQPGSRYTVHSIEFKIDLREDWNMRLTKEQYGNIVLPFGVTK